MANNQGKVPVLSSQNINCRYVEVTADKALTGLVAGFTIMGQTPDTGDVIALMAQATATENGVYLYTVTAANYTLTLIAGGDLSTASTVTGQRFIQAQASAASNGGITYTWYIDNVGAVKFAALQTEGSNQVTKSYASTLINLVAGASDTATITFAPDVWTSIVEKTLRVYLDGGTTPAPLAIIVTDTTQTADNLTGIRVSVTNAGSADVTGFIVRVGVTGVAG